LDEFLGADLAVENAEKTYGAVRTLSQASEDIPSLTGKRLRPSRSLSGVIADLNSDDFKRREAASKEPVAFGPRPNRVCARPWWKPIPKKCVPVSNSY